MKRLLAITATILIALSLCCCSNQENNPEEAKSDSNTESITSEAKTSDVFIPDWDAARNRTTWNIELSLVEINERNIIIEMVDYDNIGFLMNDLYYVLERWEEGEYFAA